MVPGAGGQEGCTGTATFPSCWDLHGQQCHHCSPLTGLGAAGRKRVGARLGQWRGKLMQGVVFDEVAGN